MSKRKYPAITAQGHGYVNKAFVGAFNKGMDARVARRPLKSCPYKPIMRSDGRVTFSAGYAAAWRAGWKSTAA